MLEVGRAEAEREGLANIVFQRGDAAALPFLEARCSSHGRPASWYSLRMCPAPSPSSIRPSESTSAVATARASSAGFQNPALST